MLNFEKLGIQTNVIQLLKKRGIVTPTPIQAETIPLLLRGKDVIGKAQTGTGKTLAFTLPILEKINPNQNVIQALVVTPTRELALQITKEVKKVIPEDSDINVLAVYGGQDVDRQMKLLKGNIHIVIGTPGGLLDHIGRGTIDFSYVTMLILDEADQMLHIGFLGEVEEIIEETSPTRQTLLYSATIPKEISVLAKKYMQNPQEVRVQDSQITVKEIKQVVVETTDRAKLANLCQMIDENQPFLAIIFCRTKRRVSKLNGDLKARHYLSDELHGDLSQSKREKVMERFRQAKIQLLVATDVAARGLDVEGVTHVFNYDIPQDVDGYIHRIGRTGRAGEDGLAVTLVAAKDRIQLDEIEKGMNITIERRTLN